MDGLLADLRVALRGLIRAPGFAFSAVIILALGIGANITAFAALKIAVLTPPPFPEADRLVSVDLTSSAADGARISHWTYPYVQKLEDLPDRLIDPVASYRSRVATLTGFGPANSLPIEIVSPGYFSVVGLPMTLGRGFVAEEGDPTGPYRVAVVSHAFWQTWLGGDRAALGRGIQLNGEGFQVVGVAPRGFNGFAGDASLWLPLGAYAVFQPGVLQQPYNFLAWVVGRLSPGATLAAADAQMDLVSEAISADWPRSEPFGVRVRAFAEVWTNADAQTASAFLALAAGLVLFVACANLAGLLYARARRRVREGAVRRALGASRWRLIRALLAESLVLAISGGIVGLCVSSWGMRLLAVSWPTQFLRGTDSGLQVISPDGLTLDTRVTTFAVLISLAAALLIGLLPALRLSSVRITDHLKDGGLIATRRKGRTGVDPQAVLVGAQVSLALVLLVGVGLMGVTVGRLLSVDEGFRTEKMLCFSYSTPQAIPRFDPRNDTQWRAHITLSAQFDDRLIRRLSRLPGIEAVTTTGSAVLRGFQAFLGITYIEGQPDGSIGAIGVVPVADNYFEVLDVPILSGRGFALSDGLESNPVVVLNQTAAARGFPDADPVGKRIGIAFAPSGRVIAEVVGVVGDVIHTSPDGEPEPVAYFSIRERRHGTSAMVRTTENPSNVVRSIREEIYAMDPTVAIDNVATLDQIISRSVGDRRLILWLLLTFAGITVLLAAVGTWGVVAQTVADRQRELGLRIALGAEGKQVLRIALRRSVLAALIGVPIGLAGAWTGSRLLEAFLWNTNAHDPKIFLAGGTLLFAVVLLASYFPARRAIRVDPVEVLRVAE